MPYTINSDMWVDPYIEFGANRNWYGNTFLLGKAGVIEPPNALPFITYMDRIAEHRTPPPVNGESQIFVANADVKNIIESFEPNLHDFVPMELRYGTPEEYESYQYFAVRVNQSFDAVDVEKSDVTIIVQPNGNRVWSKKARVPLVLKPAMIEGKHLWMSAHLFCSDALHDELKLGGSSVGWRFEKQVVA